MKKICFLGDIYTATAFRLAGVEITVTRPEQSARDLALLLKKADAAVILVTTPIAASLQSEIYETNLNRTYPVILEVPEIKDIRDRQTSLIEYITEALGMSL